MSITPTEPNTVSTPFDLWTEWLSWPGRSLAANRFPLAGDVMQWIRAWGQAVGQFGFFNVNIGNSADPGLEHRIASNYSYGRQLGRILDVVAPLVESQEKLLLKQAGKSNVDDFKRMVEDIKRWKGVRRREPSDIISDIKAWQHSSPETFMQDLDELARAIEELRGTDATSRQSVRPLGEADVVEK
jgi:hypothetical protein